MLILANFASDGLGTIQKCRPYGRRGGWGYPKLMTKSDIAGGVHANRNISTKKSVGVNFYFQLVSGQCGSSWAEHSTGGVVSSIDPSPHAQAK